jgi:hypothetical protein
MAMNRHVVFNKSTSIPSDFSQTLRRHKSQPYCSLANELWCNLPKMTGFQ